MLDHLRFTERIAAYLAQGLGEEEIARFERHAAECPACAAALKAEREAEQGVRQLFTGIGPTAGAADRVIRQLRVSRQPRMILAGRLRIHPQVKRAAYATAAAVLLAGVGYVGNGMLEKDTRPVPALSLMMSDAAKKESADTFGGGTKVALTKMLSGKEQQNLSYSYACPYPDNNAASSGFTMTHGMEPTFAVFKAGNVLSGDTSSSGGRVGGDNGSAALALADGEPKDGLQDGQKGQQQGGQQSNDQQGGPVSEAPAAPTAQPANSTPKPTATAPVSPTSGRQVVRHGDISFIVDNFDTALERLSKIATEEGGFIADSNSSRGDNGKMSGVVTLRVPPEHLDTLVLELRGLGDLQSQQIVSDDVTKDYTDLQSELRAARAMEQRLLDLIQNGKGSVKDLLAAENELGAWREKIEHVTGEINYYNNLISLSTLRVTMTERDIHQSSLTTEQETINMGIQTEDVEKEWSAVLHAVDDVKGRIIQSDLKKYDAGQLAATVVAEVAPASAGPVLDRLKQLGQVTRLDAQRQQTTPNGAEPLPGAHVEQKPTQFSISLYNLANIAPRQTTTLALACDDVEASYKAIIAAVSSAGGRVINSGLNRSSPQQIDGQINFDVPTEKADSALAALRAQGQVMQMNSTENPDTANVTAAKRGFNVTLGNADTIPPRETTTAEVQTSDPQETAAKLQAAVLSAGGKMLQDTLAQQETTQVHLVFDVPVKQATDFIARLRDSGRLKSIDQSVDSSVAMSDFARARFDVVLETDNVLVGNESGVWASFKGGLATSIRGLLLSLQLIVIGLCLVLPWTLLGWLGWRTVRWVRKPLGKTA